MSPKFPPGAGDSPHLPITLGSSSPEPSSDIEIVAPRERANSSGRQSSPDIEIVAPPVRASHRRRPLARPPPGLLRSPPPLPSLSGASQVPGPSSQAQAAPPLPAAMSSHGQLPDVRLPLVLFRTSLLKLTHRYPSPPKNSLSSDARHQGAYVMHRSHTLPDPCRPPRRKAPGRKPAPPKPKKSKPKKSLPVMRGTVRRPVLLTMDPVRSIPQLRVHPNLTSRLFRVVTRASRRVANVKAIARAQSASTAANFPTAHWDFTFSAVSTSAS